MARRHRQQQPKDWLFPDASIDPRAESSLLDVIDKVLNKGAVIKGDLVLGVANVDLIYAELSALLAAVDRVMRSEDSRRSPKAVSRRSTKGSRRPTKRSQRSTKPTSSS
jgi:hypothetical protein